MFYSAEGFSQSTHIRLIYTDDYLQGDQLELSLNQSIKKTPFSFELGMARSPDLKSYNVKTGFNYYYSNKSNYVNFSIGLRAVHARFKQLDTSGVRFTQIATYFDMPFRADFKMRENLFLTTTFNPTYNTYSLLNDKIILQGGIGIGYAF